MSKNHYMVPMDFTEISNRALEFALFLGKRVQTEICLLHLAVSKEKAMAAQGRLEEVIKNTVIPPGVELIPQAKQGSIFSDIGKIAKEDRTQLIVMGTHGMRGMQSLFGSHAMKVVTSAECPFLIVQKHTPIKDIKRIVVPIDLTKESLQIVNIAGDMANIVGAEIYILAEKQTDEILNNRLKTRLSIVKKEYEDRGIEPNVTLMKQSGSYRSKIINFCKQNAIDMIAFAYHSESLLPQFDKFAQILITNKVGLPVMIVNSKLASALYF